MSRALLVLDSDFQRRKAQDWVWGAKPGSRVEFKGPQRSLDQNSLMWALLTDVAVHMRKAAGLDYSTEDWKHVFLHGWGREVRFLPALDGKGVVPVPQSSSDLSKEEMTDFVEYILKEGTERGVTFHNPSESSAAQSPASDEGSEADTPSPLATGSTMEAGSIGAPDGQDALPVSTSLSDEDRAWLKLAAKMLLAVTRPGWEADGVRGQYAALMKTQTPKEVSQVAIAKAKAIGARCVAVCDSTEDLDIRHIAGLALCDVTELREVVA